MDSYERWEYWKKIWKHKGSCWTCVGIGACRPREMEVCGGWRPRKPRKNDHIKYKIFCFRYNMNKLKEHIRPIRNLDCDCDNLKICRLRGYKCQHREKGEKILSDLESLIWKVKKHLKMKPNKKYKEFWEI